MFYLIVKRIADIALSLILLVLLLPLFLVVIVCLKFSGEGEVFYFQERVGYRNKRFDIWKFATMLKNSAKMAGGEITLRNDPRVTTVGRILRMTKINELPQIINVLIGDMSFVGPRPLMPVSFYQYSETVQAIVYNSKPGITGIGSIIFRDEEKLVSESNLPPQEYYTRFIFPYKGELETWYQQHKSLYVDFMLAVLTVIVILSPESKLPYKIFPSLPKRSF